MTEVLYVPFKSRLIFTGFFVFAFACLLGLFFYIDKANEEAIREIIANEPTNLVKKDQLREQYLSTISIVEDKLQQLKKNVEISSAFVLEHKQHDIYSYLGMCSSQLTGANDTLEKPKMKSNKQIVIIAFLFISGIISLIFTGITLIEGVKLLLRKRVANR